MKKLIVLAVMIFYANAFADYYYDEEHFMDSGRVILDLGIASMSKDNSNKLSVFNQDKKSFDVNTGYYIGLSYQVIVSKYFSIEPFISYYSFEDSYSYYDSMMRVMDHKVEFESVPLGVNLNATLPLGRMFEIYAFGGFSVNFNEFRYKMSNFGSVSHNDASVGVQGGAGANVLLGKHFLLGIKYTYAYNEQTIKYMQGRKTDLDTSKHVFAARLGIRL